MRMSGTLGDSIAGVAHSIVQVRLTCWDIIVLIRMTYIGGLYYRDW